MFEIINATKCNMNKAANIFEEMIELGLGLDRKTNDVISETYDLISFAELREYFSDKEFEIIYERLKNNEHFIHVMKESKEKYELKYGSDRSKWPKEIIEEIEKKFDTKD